MKTTPRDFFFLIATFATLYISAVSLLTLLFQYIDILFGDTLQSLYYDPYSGAIRFSIASLIIIFPLYLYLTRSLNQEVRAHPEKKELGVRKWLIYLTLFIAGTTIIIDLIVLINTFLGGEVLTSGFILKVLSIIIVIGGVFMYYLQDLKGTWEKSKSLSQIIGGVVTLMVLTSIIGGFFIIGSPQTQRLMRFDQDKINDLSSIQWQVVTYFQQKETLPQTLAELEDPLTGFILPTDAQTDTAYSYEVVEGLTFKLCADFNKESKGYTHAEPKAVRLESSVRYGGFDNENWAHGEGETCFERTIDPDKFPAFKG
ncbi:MAG: DUF5671 domain-containing protein [Candidatus Paceibacterota bacterium]